MNLIKPELPDAYYTLMKWVDEARKLNVRTNVDTPYDAENAIRLGAEGIGLCRTEHMFFDTDERRLAIQEMILADDVEARKTALNRLLPFQREDFKGIFRAMDGKPVTIRLIDPPLHEFVPHTEGEQRHLAEKIGVPYEQVRRRVERLKEANPMLGHRGCRLCITYPEILEMQVRAMIEVPRAALLADEIAEVAEFFSFGTNDLTQMTLGMSRDDAGRFLPDYVDEKRAGILKSDPFQSLDQDGVGMLIKIAIEKGRKAKKDLKIGICGEHGGDPATVEFCHKNGFNYVSCSPFRVPIARLAAAHAVLKDTGSNGLKKKARR